MLRFDPASRLWIGDCRESGVKGRVAVTDLVVSEDVGRVPGVLADVGDSLSVGDPSQAGGQFSPSLIAAMWVSNEVLPQLNQAHADQIYAAGEATHQHHQAVMAVDESGARVV